MNTYYLKKYRKSAKNLYSIFYNEYRKKYEVKKRIIPFCNKYKLQDSYYELKNAIFYLNYIRREYILNCVTHERKKKSKSIKLNM